MPEYRLYLLDSNQKIVDAKLLFCRDDDFAFSVAFRSLSVHGVELWRGTRLIGRLEPPRCNLAA